MRLAALSVTFMRNQSQDDIGLRDVPDAHLARWLLSRPCMAPVTKLWPR